MVFCRSIKLQNYFLASKITIKLMCKEGFERVTLNSKKTCITQVTKYLEPLFLIRLLVYV